MRSLRLLCQLLLWACVMGAPVQAANRADAPPAEPSVAKKDRKKTSAPRTSAAGGSSESASERQARLRRECKGRPNAGACTGYTD